MVVIYLTMSWFYSFFVRFFCILFLFVFCILDTLLLLLFALNLFTSFSTAFHITMNFQKNKIIYVRSQRIPVCICAPICHRIALVRWSVMVSVCVCNNWWSNIKLQSIKGIHITASFPLDLCWICVLATAAEHIKIPLIHFISTLLCSNQFSFSLLDLFFSFSSMPVITSI